MWEELKRVASRGGVQVWDFGEVISGLSTLTRLASALGARATRFRIETSTMWGKFLKSLSFLSHA
jgi:hypothetical protein